MRKHQPKFAASTIAATARPFIAAIGFAAVLAVSGPAARAQDFTHDGYALDGTYMLNVELTPYGFLPHVATTVNGIGPRGRAGVSGSISGWQIVHSLNGAFFGDGLARYGPYSAEINIDWVDLGGGKDIALPRLGRSAHLDASGSMVLVSPGVGYQIYRGQVALAPVTVDARVGFQYMSWSTSASTAEDLLGGASGSGDKASPWLGIRTDVFPMPDLRVRFAGNLTGLGSNNGSWGWTTTLTLTYLFNNWFDASIGISALQASASADRTDIFGTHRSTLHAIAYGPVIGVGFRF